MDKLIRDILGKAGVGVQIMSPFTVTMERI